MELEVRYNGQYLKRRFNKWATIELKMLLEELLEKKDKQRLTHEERLIVSPVKAEIERRANERV